MEQKRDGHFDDQHREYVITDPQTPWPWITYLGNEDFFSLISNTAGGYSFYKDAKFRRLTRYRYNGVPMDNGGRYFYIKTSPSSSVANGGFAPLCGAAATSVAALKSSVANEGFAPLCGAAATPVAALKTPVAPVASALGSAAFVAKRRKKEGRA